MDFTLFEDINGLTGDGTLDGVMRFAAQDLVYVLVAIVALLFLVPWSRRRFERRTGAVSATAAAGLALLIAQPIAHAVDRMRPFVAHPGQDHLLVMHANDTGFPSDHTTAAFALAVAVFAYDRVVGTILLVLGALVGFARVFVGVHYPGDVVGGAAIGTAVALVLVLPPLAYALRAITRACSALWERVLAMAFGRRFARVR